LLPRGRFASDPDVLLQYRWHDSNASVVHSEHCLRAHDRLIEKYMLEYGIASSADEVRRFLDFERNGTWEHRDRREPLSAGHFSAGARVQQRFFAFIQRLDDRSGTDSAAIRQELRWYYLRRAERAGWLSREGLRWLQIARRIDPVAMRPDRIASRFCRAVGRRLAAFGANGPLPAASPRRAEYIR
jgi:hypothetical protein